MVDQFAQRLKNMRKRISAWAQMSEAWHQVNASSLVMVTLTYRPEVEWQSGHIGEYCRALNDRHGQIVRSYAWVAELQDRGAVHYHVVVLVNGREKLPMPDTSGEWPYGLSEIARARTPWYLLTYAGKERQKDLSAYPKGCKLYGVSVRGMPAEYIAVYRNLSGLDRQLGREVAWMPDGEGGHAEWVYEGAAVTKDFTTDILVPISESRGTI